MVFVLNRFLQYILETDSYFIIWLLCFVQNFMHFIKLLLKIPSISIDI